MADHSLDISYITSYHFCSIPDRKGSDQYHYNQYSYYQYCYIVLLTVLEGTVKYYAQIRLQVWQNKVCTRQGTCP